MGKVMVLKYPADYVSHGQYVTADNTGVPTGHSLVDVASSITVTESWITNSNGGSRVIENKNFLSGAGVSVQVSNFTIRYCKFNGAGDPTLYKAAIQCGPVGSPTPFTNVYIQWCEFDGQKLNTGGDSAIIGDGFRLLRCHIHDWPRFVYHGGQGDDQVVECYMHNLVRDDSGQHLEGMLWTGGPNISILRNKIVLNYVTSGSNPMAGAISLFNGGSFPALVNVQIEDNYLAGGGFTLYAGCISGEGWGPYATYTTISGNIFGRDLYENSGVYAPAYGFDTSQPGNSWTNNTWGPPGPYWQAGDPEEGAVIASPGSA